VGNTEKEHLLFSRRHCGLKQSLLEGIIKWELKEVLCTLEAQGLFQGHSSVSLSIFFSSSLDTNCWVYGCSYFFFLDLICSKTSVQSDTDSFLLTESTLCLFRPAVVAEPTGGSGCASTKPTCRVRHTSSPFVREQLKCGVTVSFSLEILKNDNCIYS